MNFIRPFKGLRPSFEQAQAVTAPPYDVLSTEEAKELAQGNELSFLHLSKPEIDLPESVGIYDDEVYQKGASNLKRFIDEGVLTPDEKDYYYFYEMKTANHVQMGLVAVASVEKYDQNLIAKHELTREDKESDRIRMITAMNCQASPVLLACQPLPELLTVAAQAAQAKPDADVEFQGVQHRLWVVRDSGQAAEIDAMFNGEKALIKKLYIADGHHRSASASKICAQQGGKGNTGWFLSVIYPADQMKILDYNRVVKDLNGLTEAEVIEAARKGFEVLPMDAQHKPREPKEIGMYLKGQWYSLKVKPECIPADPTASLDVAILYDQLLAPALGVGNPRKDKRIDFVGGARGLAELERRVDSGEMAVAFAMYPTQMDDIIRVADANEIMPPKSTWFEPKLVDGLVSHSLE